MIIRFISWAENQHIRIISEGSYDTEDWSNDAENSALTSQEWITFYNILTLALFKIVIYFDRYH